MQTESPQWPRGEGACRAGASDHLPSTDRKQAHGAHEDLQGPGPASRAPRQTPEDSVEAFLLFKNIRISVSYLLVAGGGGTEKEGEREREGEGRQGTAGARSLSALSTLPSSCSPGSSGGGRTWPSAAGGGHPPSSREGPPWGTTMDFLPLLPAQARVPTLPSGHTAFRPQAGATSARASRAVGCPGCPQSQPPQAHPGLPTTSAPAQESPTLLTDPSPQAVGPDGDGSHGPTLSEAPQQKCGQVPREACERRGAQRAPGSGLGSGAADNSESPFPGRALSHLAEGSLASSK